MIRTDMFIFFNIDAVTCSSLSLSNDEVSYSGSAVNGEYPVNTVASFTCNSGYALSGSESSTCETSGTWNEQYQMCNQGEVEGIWLKIKKMRNIWYKGRNSKPKYFPKQKLQFFHNLDCNIRIGYCQYYASID